MRIGHQLAALAAHHRADLGMRLVVQEAIDHMRARPLQPPRLADIGGLVKPCLQLDQCRHRLPVLGGLAQGLDNWGIPAGPVERLFDRHHVRVHRRLLQEAHHHVEGLIRVVQQHILLADRREHVALVVLNPLRNARLERGPEQVRPAVQNQLRQIGQADHAAQLDHLLLAHVQLVHDHAT